MTTMIDGFTCIEDVYRAIRSVIVLDLAKDVDRMSSEYKEALKPPPIGSYLKGHLEPIKRETSRKEILQQHCDFEYSAVWLKIIAAVEYLNTLHPKVPCSCSIPSNRLKLDEYVDKAYLTDPAEDPMAFDPDGSESIRTLKKKLAEFVGQDHASYYTVSLDNTTLTIKKGFDYRIVEYYRLMFEGKEN